MKSLMATQKKLCLWSRKCALNQNMDSFQLAAAEFLISYTFKVRSQLRLYCKYRTLNNIKTIKTRTKCKNLLQKVSKYLVFLPGRLLGVVLVVRKVWIVHDMVLRPFLTYLATRCRLKSLFFANGRCSWCYRLMSWLFWCCYGNIPSLALQSLLIFIFE